MPREDDHVVRFKFSDADLQECHPSKMGVNFNYGTPRHQSREKARRTAPVPHPQRHSTSPRLMTKCRKLGQS